jgi:hypothetical protein
MHLIRFPSARIAVGLLVLIAASAGCKGRFGPPVPGQRPKPAAAAAPAQKAEPVEEPGPLDDQQLADGRNPPLEPSPLDTAAEPAPPPPPPPPPPEFPAAARERLTALGVRITDKPDGYGVDVRRNAKFGDDEIALVCESAFVNDLTMEGVLITNAGIELLQKLPKLKRLILNDTPLGGKELETLAGHPLRTELISIGLRGTQIRDDDLRWLKEFTVLERLDVSSTVLTDACLPHLEDLPLLTINVMGTQISADGVARLKQKNPKLILRQ